MKKVFIVSNEACPRRLLDMEKIATYFRLNGYQVSRTPRNADYKIFVSCAFIERQVNTALKDIWMLGKYPGKLIVTGCLPKIEPKMLKKIHKGPAFPINRIEHIDSFFPDFRIKFKDIPEPNMQFGEKRSKLRFRKHEARIRIAWGCSQRCSFCAIRQAIGSLRSKPLDVIKKEYSDLLSSGYRRFVFIAANTGSYGTDIGTSLTGLMNNLDEIDSGKSVTWDIRELNALYVVIHREKLVDEIRRGKIPALQCITQSGSERILKLMNRYSDVKKIESTLRYFRSIRKNLILSTHIIVGFPTETEEDFQKTLDFLNRIQFNHITFFPYFDAPGTAAFRMKRKVPAETVKERIDKAVRQLRSRRCKTDVFS